VKVPTEDERKRVRDILDEFRRRASQSGRPTIELDYIDRLSNLAVGRLAHEDSGGRAEHECAFLNWLENRGYQPRALRGTAGDTKPLATAGTISVR
jgi:hypothetical protein